MTPRTLDTTPITPRADWLSPDELRQRYPRLLAAARHAAILADTEAIHALQRYRAGCPVAGEAVNHYGGTRAVLEAAYRHRHAAQGEARARAAYDAAIAEGKTWQEASTAADYAYYPAGPKRDAYITYRQEEAARQQRTEQAAARIDAATQAVEQTRKQLRTAHRQNRETEQTTRSKKRLSESHAAVDTARQAHDAALRAQLNAYDAYKQTATPQP
jgi:hypothetical protein